MSTVPLHVSSAEPAHGLVDAIERLLADVKAGRVREVAYAARATGAEVHTALAGEPDDVFRMLGAVRYLEHRILRTVEYP